MKFKIIFILLIGTQLFGQLSLIKALPLQKKSPEALINITNTPINPLRYNLDSAHYIIGYSFPGSGAMGWYGEPYAQYNPIDKIGINIKYGFLDIAVGTIVKILKKEEFTMYAGFEKWYQITPVECDVDDLECNAENNVYFLPRTAVSLNIAQNNTSSIIHLVVYEGRNGTWRGIPDISTQYHQSIALGYSRTYEHFQQKILQNFTIGIYAQLGAAKAYFKNNRDNSGYWVADKKSDATDSYYYLHYNINLSIGYKF